MEHGRNIVFINPNFNRRKIVNVPDTAMRQATLMHVNPNFCPHSQNLQPIPKTRIYVNPNFVRPNGVNNHFPYVNNTSAIQPYVKPSPLMDSSNTLTVPVVTPARLTMQSSPLTNAAPMQPFQTNSRYSLVRQKKPKEPLPNNVKPITSTIKISKYKSLKITDIKNNLDSVQPIEKLVPLQVSNDNKLFVKTSYNHNSPKMSTNHINRYKFIKPTVCKLQFKRQTSNTPKKVACRTKMKAVGMYKKNNIPCPQYRKYGKCLRQSYGRCEFLHDKKHVSICRKFLNGVCHNDKCLLSHELSDKKMPTCYFYLKGICTKEKCPYLHVKLNEKAKICSDFTRGYCEKGDKCLNRHVSKGLNADLKRRHSLMKLSQQKLTKYRLEKNKIKSNTNIMPKRKSKIELNQQALHDSSVSASRYYKESVQEYNVSENLEIKPSRCKLGTLPSFIQL